MIICAKIFAEYKNCLFSDKNGYIKQNYGVYVKSICGNENIVSGWEKLRKMAK
jgi:hypothetical protein